MNTDQQLSLFSVWGNSIEFAVFNAFPEGESPVVEYKSAKGGFPDSFWETYSAFANTEGGMIVLGIREKENKLSVDGLTYEQAQQYKRIFFDTVNNRNKISHNLLSDEDIKILPVPEQADAFLLAFQIPRARLDQMPVYKGSDMFAGTYKRNDTGDYRCDKDVVRHIVSDSNPTIPIDSKIYRNFTLIDLDIVSVRQYRQLMASRKPDHPWLVFDDKTFLQKLGAWRKDRNNGIEGVTLAGLVMFGKTEAINDIEALPTFFLDYQEVLTQDTATRWTDRIYPDGTWEANLFQFYQRVWPQLSAGLPRPFYLKDGVRQDETPAHVALREAFVNALIHADYTAPGNLTIIRRLSGFEFKNPGTLLISQRQYYEGGTSICRNKALQKMFMLIGRAEQAGSGSGKILSGWESAQWQRPFLTLKDHPDQVILALYMESMLPDEIWRYLEKIFGEKASFLYGDDLQVLSLVVQEGKVSNQRLQYCLDLHRVDISALLKRLCQEEFLVPSGKGRGTVYTLNIDYLKTHLKQVESFNTKKNLESKGSNLESNTTGLESKGSNLESNTTGLESKGDNLESKNALFLITEKKNTQELILEFVKDNFETAEAISKAINRSAAYLKNEVIPKMLEDGLLELLHPGQRRHRAQAYKTNTQKR